MAMQRLAGVCLVGVVALVGASCATHGTASPPRHDNPPTVPSPSTSLASGSPIGSQQTATDPSGQKVTATATKPDHTGEGLGGPRGSWVMGLTVENIGPGAYRPAPASQVILTDTAGKSYRPVEVKPATAPLAVGQQARVLLYFALAPGATPRVVDFAPFGSSAPSVRWST
jgi:hypothetical protein